MKITNFELTSYFEGQQIHHIQLDVLSDNRITRPVEIQFPQDPNELPVVRARTNDATYKTFDHRGHGYRYPVETRKDGTLTFQTQLPPGPVRLIIVENKGLNQNKRSVITGIVEK
jgi:hypothetical protein